MNEIIALLTTHRFKTMPDYLQSVRNAFPGMEAQGVEAIARHVAVFSWRGRNSLGHLDWLPDTPDWVKGIYPNPALVYDLSGGLAHVTYTLPPAQAVIAAFEQMAPRPTGIKGNFHTWNYLGPAEHPALRFSVSGRTAFCGDFACFL